MVESEENSQDNSFSQTYSEDKYELVYDQKSKEASENNSKEVTENISKNSFTFGSTDQSKLFSIPQKYSNIHFFCSKCWCIPILVFKSVLNIIYTCKCNENCSMNIIKYFGETLNISEENEEKDIEEIKKKEKENNILLDIFYCQKHKGQKFFVHCQECDTSLCQECLTEEKEHKDHQLLFFDILKKEANKNLAFIIKNFSLIPLPYDNESSDFLDDNLRIVREQYIKFINVLINDYNNYPCYSHFKNISNLDKALEIFITDFTNLKKYIHEKPSLNLITGIRLIDNNICNIKLFCEANLINLKVLNLRQNKITNIALLNSAKFKNIEILDLSLNKLGDDNIEIIAQFKFEDLEILNLFGNNFSDYKIFGICNNKKFKNLKILFAGFNNFKNNKINATIDTSNLEKIGLTTGVFNDESIHFIHFFSFNNLLILYLHSNNLSSLSFIDNLDLPNIRSIWVNNNKLKDFYSLCKYKTLEFINIRRNEIKNIDNLIPFMDKLKRLKKIDMTYNNIDFNDNKNKNIISEAQNRLGEKNFIF